MLLSFLDGIFMFPACVLIAKLNGQISVSLLSNYKFGIGQVYANSYLLLGLFFLALVMYLLRPIVVGEIHFTYYRRWINEPNKMSFFVTIVVVPLAVIFLTPWLDGNDQISIKFTTAL